MASYMKIHLIDIFINYEYWMHDKELMKYDLSITVDGKKYELSGIQIPNNTVSYRDGENIHTISAEQVSDIEVNASPEEINELILP
jgi:uncharacterized Zn finger protein